jgi:hypothetical protein
LAARRDEGRRLMSRREIIDLLSRKKRLSAKEFLELYDAIWDGSASVTYKNPAHAEREHVRMLRKQYRSV